MKDIQFVSYDGRWPNLCSGVLTVIIDEKKYKFGHSSNDYDFKNNCYNDNNFNEFWKSGGRILSDEKWDMWSEHGEWELSYEPNDYPKEIIELLPDLIKIFNEHVPYGCCGGCL